MLPGYFKRRLGIFFLISFITSLPFVVFAQDYSYVNYDVKDGLAGSTVYCMVQDKDGFIWFGTETGLSRFDGTNFKNFSTADGLPDNEIVKLFVDSKNRIWIVLFRNSLCYYWNGRIYNAENDSSLRKIKTESEMISILENGSGDLLIQEVNAAHVIDHSGEIYKIDKLAGRPIRAIKAGLNKDREFRLAFVYTSGVNLVIADIQNRALTVIQDIPKSAQNNYGSIFFNPHLEIYAKSNSLHFICGKGKESAFEYLVSEGFINSCGITDTTFAFNYVSKTLLFDVGHKKIIDSFSVGQPINTVIQDSEGSLWFSTMGKGVYRLASSDFENYSFKTLGIPSSVFCVKKFDSTIYVGTANFFAWALNSNLSIIKSKQLKHGLTRGRIITITKIADQHFIIGTDNGLFAFNNWKIKSFFTGVAIKDVFLDTDGKIIVSASRYALRIDPVQLKLVDTIWGDRSTCAYKLNDTNYVGTLNGLFVIDANRKFYFAGDRNELLKKRIAAIAASGDGTLWIATSGNGLIAYRSGKVVRAFTTKDGLTSDICRNIFISSNDVWTGTDKGLNKISSVDTGYTITILQQVMG